MLKGLLEDWRLAMDADKLDEARKHRMTCEQVARLCDDPALMRVHARLAAHHEMRFGDRESALRAQRRAVMTVLAMEDFPTEELFDEARRFCVALRYSGRVAEALTYTQAFLILGERLGSDWDSYKTLRGFEGFLLIELGHFEQGIAKSQAALHMVQGRYRQAIENGIAAAMYFSGIIAFEALWHFGQPSASRSNMIVELGLWQDNPAQLRAALNQYDGPPRPEIHAAKALVLARTHRRASAYREFLAAVESTSRERDLTYWCLAGQVAHACRNGREVESAVMAAETAVDQLPRGAQPPTFHWAIHCRTVLRAMHKTRHKQLRDKARAFIVDRVNSGSRLFASALDEASTA